MRARDSCTMRALLLLFSLVAVASPSSSIRAALATPLSHQRHRTVGGEDASRGEFPWQVMITRGVGGSLLCSGSLVALDVVVTSGTCCDGFSASRLGVEVGSFSLYENDPDQESFAVAHVMLHENYNPMTVENDICLLKLAGEVTLGPNVATIGLPADQEDYPEGADCVVSGWGTTSTGGDHGGVQQKFHLQVVSDSDCRDIYGQGEIADFMICAGAVGDDFCQGNSGGPLICEPTYGQMAGIVSWGYGCGNGFPGVYTQTSYFVDWINAHM